MPSILTPLRNIKQSTAAGSFPKTSKSPKGLNRASSLNSPASVGSRAQQGAGPGGILQYPLDLSSDGNGHFILFHAKKMTAPQLSFSSKDIDKTREAIKNVTKKIGGKFDETQRRLGARGLQGDHVPVIRETLIKNETDRLDKQLKQQVRSRNIGGGSGKSIRELLTDPGSIQTVKSIALHFPPSIQQSYDLKYNEQSISPQAAFGAEIIAAFIAQGATPAAFKSSVDPAINMLKSMANRTGLAALDAVAPGSSAIYALNRGKIFAPKMEVMFEGIGKRSFSYSFIFNPSSEDEAAEVHRIITAFRYHAAADFANETSAFGFELTIPDVFDIEYYTNGNQENGYLHKIGTCSLEKVDVTYGGDKLTWHPTTSDGAPPTKTTMTLNFKELRTVTKAAIEQGF
jgi:hypothetical protein